MNKELLAIWMFCFLVVGVSIVYIMTELSAEWVTIRARIVKKYERTNLVLVSTGKVVIPIYTEHYYFVMNNGDTVEVSSSDYLKYDVGDIYEYQKRKG